jgi:hypothetical protein
VSGYQRPTGRHDQVVADPDIGKSELLDEARRSSEGVTGGRRTGLRQVDAARH